MLLLPHDNPMAPPGTIPAHSGRNVLKHVLVPAIAAMLTENLRAVRSVSRSAEIWVLDDASISVIALQDGEDDRFEPGGGKLRLQEGSNHHCCGNGLEVVHEILKLGTTDSRPQLCRSPAPQELVALARGPHTKLVAVGIGHDDPAHPALTDVDAGRPEADETLDLRLLIAVDGWSDVKV